MTFTDALNNQETKAMVHAIEDTLSSLESYPNGEPSLQAVLDSQISDLKQISGYEYVVE